jgi:hypothetical protein
MIQEAIVIAQKGSKIIFATEPQVLMQAQRVLQKVKRV